MSLDDTGEADMETREQSRDTACGSGGGGGGGGGTETKTGMMVGGRGGVKSGVRV